MGGNLTAAPRAITGWLFVLLHDPFSRSSNGDTTSGAGFGDDIAALGVHLRRLYKEKFTANCLHHNFRSNFPRTAAVFSLAIVEDT